MSRALAGQGKPRLRYLAVGYCEVWHWRSGGIGQPQTAWLQQPGLGRGHGTAPYVFYEKGS